MSSARAVAFSRLLAAALIVSVVAACDPFATPSQSPAGPPAHPAPVSGPAISGTIVDPRDKAVPGLTVQASVGLSGGEALATGVRALFTAGLSCFVSTGCTDPVTVAETARDGGFVVPVPSGTFDPKDRLRVSIATHPDADSRVVTTYVMPLPTGSHVDLGRIVLPDGGPRLVGHGPHAELVMPSPSGDLSPSTVAYTDDPLALRYFQPVGADDTHTFRNGSFDTRVLEDSSALLFGADQVRRDGRLVTIIGTLRVTGAAAAPSRHAVCTIDGAGGRPFTLRPCSYTRGPNERGLADDPKCGGRRACGTETHSGIERQVTIRLPHPFAATLVVIHGDTCESGCAVSTSLDGRRFSNWRAFTTMAFDKLALLALPGAQIAYLRLQVNDLFELDRVAVW